MREEEGPSAPLILVRRPQAEVAWKDRDLYHRGHLRCASAFLALGETLDRHRPLEGGESEFLSLCKTVVAAPAEVFTRVWTDPAANHWVRLAYELTGAAVAGTPLSAAGRAYRKALGERSIGEALGFHLGEFKRFALAVAWMERARLRFAEPLPVGLPFALPGTRWTLAGRGEVALRGVVDGKIELESNGAAATPRECPAAILGNAEIDLNPAAFHLPGVGFAAALIEFDGDFQAAHRSLVEDALGLVRRYAPPVFAHFGEMMRVIALKPETAGDFSNMTYSDLRGAAVCSVMRDPYWFADSLIHELHHSRLFFIEDSHRFLDDPNDDPETDARYYSPWRNDLRPLHGLFHALYVYLPLWRFWYAVHDSGETSGERQSLVRDQVVRGSLQLAVAAGQLERHARFSGFGRALFEEFKAEVEEIREAVRARRLSADEPAMTCRADGTIEAESIGPEGRSGSVRDFLVDHLQRFDRLGQCSEVAAALLG